MRSIGLLAVATGTLVLASACSEGSGLIPPENEAPVAMFTVPPCTIDVACTFASSSTDDEQVTRWSWDFDGDGGADASTPEASFTYKTAKDFKVSLTVYDAQGLSQTRTSDITIAPAPVATAPTAGFTHSCDGPSCTFANTSSDVAPGTIATHAWTFGDGGTSDQASPSHTYTVSAATEFTVTLTVTDNEGASDSEAQTITVTPAASVNPPNAGFTNACTLTVCTFVSTSTDVAPGTIASYAWAFGDGGTSDQASPSHTYTVSAATEFTVTLTVTDNEGGSDFETHTITVTPAPVNPPSAGFTNACTLAVCTFVSTSTDVAPGTIASYAWAFGDGGTSDQASPSHTYTVPAATEFTVTLTVTDNEGGSDFETHTITVTPAPVNPPSAGFTNACTLTVCTFVSTSTDVAPGTIASYAWAFGDGGTAAVKNPSHTYSVTGRTDFTVTLTVTDNEGATAVATRTITVDPVPASNNPPTSSFSYSCAAAACTFISTAKDPDGAPIAKFAWTFGDGAVAVGNNPAHTYTVSAVTEFTVTLTVTDNQGATGVASQTITVNPDASVNTPPTASFTAHCYGEGCIFINNSTDASPGAIVSHAWNYGDGTTSIRNQCMPWTELCGAGRVVYSITGTATFTVTLTVTDNLGAVAVATKQVTVTPLPPAVQGCTTSGKIVECVLDIPARSNLRVTILGVSCDLGQQVNTPPPIWDLLFINVCKKMVGYSDWIWASNDQGKWLYQAGTQARIWFHQGVSTRALNPPEGRLEGTFPNWTISYEDGDHPGAPGEPDFTDLVLGVEATTVR